jgi:hypothetical protein
MRYQKAQKQQCTITSDMLATSTVTQAYVPFCIEHYTRATL